MSNNGNYIKLPYLRSISVNNYALFNESWHYEVKDGLNLFLGANGLGKTTTANMIIYGLVGLWKDEGEDISDTYFTNREHPSLKESFRDKKPSVVIKFDIGPRKVLVERFLHEPLIVSYSVDDTIFTRENTEDIEGQYKKDISSLCSLDNIEDLSFLLRKFLVREEEGNYLLWNKIDQSIIIRLLLNAPCFYKEFSMLEKGVRDADTNVRGQQDIQHQFVERQKVLILQREEATKRNEVLKTRDEIISKKDEISNQIIEFQKQKEKNLEDLSYLNNELKTLERLSHVLSSEIDTLNDEIIGLERTFFETVYFNPKISLASHKLSNYQICIFCNNKISHDKSSQITNLIEIKHNCPVCNSGIMPLPEKTKRVPIEITEKLSILRELSHDKSHQLHENTKKKSSLETSLSELWTKQKQIDENLTRMQLDLYDLNLKLSTFNEGKEVLTQYDRDIDVLGKQVDEFQKEIDKHRNTYNEKKQLLDEKNRQLNESIDEYTDKLNKIFNKYVKDYFKEDCVLVPYEGRKPTNSKVKLTTYCPQFDDKLRSDLNSVSKSEGIFLEYLFRMSLIELFYSKTTAKPFLILETSEGAFDIFRTEQLAKTIAHFGKNKFPFITIINLSKPKFVKNLILSMEKPKERTFNFLKYGVLDKEQKKHKKEFEKVLKNISK